MEATTMPEAQSGHGRMQRRVLGFSLGAVLATALLFILVVAISPGGLVGVRSATSLPPELSNAVFIASRDGHATAYSKGMFWYRTHGTVEGTASSFARYPDALFAVSHAKEGISLMMHNGREVLRAEQAIMTPTRTPNTDMVAFAQHARQDQERRSDSLPRVTAASPAEWDIYLHLLKGTTTQKVVAGYAPLFIDDFRFLFISPSGMYRYDLRTGVAARVLERTFPVVIGTVIQSPDRRLLAVRDATTNNTLVYGVEEDGLREIAVISEPLMSPALSNDALYDLRGKQTGPEVWRYGLSGEAPVHVYTFPFNLSFSRIIF